MPNLKEPRANKPGEGRAKPNSKKRRSNKQKLDKQRDLETEELRVAMGGEPKDDPVIPGFTGHLTSEDIKLVKEARRERWNTSPQVMDAISNRFGLVIVEAIRSEDDDKLLEFSKEYRQFVAQNQRDEIAQIDQGKQINVNVNITPIQRRVIVIAKIDAELRKLAIPGTLGGDHRDEPESGDELSGDDGNSESGNEPV